ncbi:hypothetical protein FJ651_04215 [Paucihalobacter ruber]|uniref:Outer membrane protein beta-barrel domain-containing protein n=1 Tax=Paucihalobacter ruber TaxID=2567861 RepID=A0A506PN91_9FLAO|nr:DUF6646 family protein [Paucihalobacter ruber]TPV34742.1 hypothetical protein FJ651_04215 [Paucihalobacter ruber]
MKNLLFIAMLASASLVYSQAFTGKGDNKFQIGLNLQDNATGINAAYDFGVGDNISFGFVGTYALGVNESIDADFGDRIDVRARFNANIGNVLDIDPNFDFYPGLSFGLKNFGGHIGARYFFSNGFGIYSEIGTPIARYDTGTLTPAEKIHNQFYFNFGAVFNL